MPTSSVLSECLITHPYWAFALSSLALILVTNFLNVAKRNPRRLPLPPGPKGYPIIGNIFDAPTDKPWLVYNEWAKIYGDMISFKVMGQQFLVLNSLRRTNDLFEKRSSNYSDRMRFPMVLELMEWDYDMGFLPYGQWWRRCRRTFHEHFNPNVITKYNPVQHREVKALLNRLLDSPENFRHHVRHALGATIMSVAYGINIKESDDPYIATAEIALEGLAEAGIPGKFWVDIFPILKHVPAWFPGAGFKKKAAYWREVNEEIRKKPFIHVKTEMAKGVAPSSVAAALIDKLPDEGDPARAEEEKIAENTAAVAYAGGADTTVSTIQAFFLAMAMYPEVQKKAHMEIDEVIGPSRLPTFNDRNSLPYINALIKESLRWLTVFPLAVGHMCTADDEYDGYFIPKGTVVFGNAWAILHDPEVYADPDAFNPDRYLKDGQLDRDVDDPDCAFGFGRRICPAKHFSDNNLYAVVSCVLATLDIKPPVNSDGKPLQLKPEVTSGLLSYPEPFECIITPRNPIAEALIRDSYELGI